LEVVKISDIKPNPSNPRVIKDDKFKKLRQSIIDFPQMLEIRPIVVNDDMIVLGGNMRLRACQDAGIKEVHIVRASNLTAEQQKEFIIKDNVGFGEWDWAMLANDFDLSELDDWGLYVPEVSSVDIDSFFEDLKDKTEPKSKIVLEYTQEDYDKVTEAFKEYDGTKEEIVARLLGV